MPAARQLPLPSLQPQETAQLVDCLGQRAERAQPAAEQPAPEQQHRGDDEDPEAEDKGIAEEQRPVPAQQQRVEPRQHLRDRRLRHRAEADKDDAERPGRVLERIDRPLVLVRGAPRQAVAQCIDQRDRTEQRDEQANCSGLLAPDLAPRRLGFVDLRPAALQHRCRQPVRRIEAGEAARAGGTVDAVAEERQLPRIRRGKRRRPDHEDRRLRHRRRALRRNAVEIEVVQVAEGERIGALAHLHAVVDAAAHEARALERLRPLGADHEDGVLARLQLPAQPLPAGIAQHAAGDVGMVQVAKPQFDKGFAATGQPDLRRLHEQPLHQPAGHHLLPAIALAAFGEPRRCPLRRRQDANLPRHRRTRCGQHLVLRDHCHGGAGNRIDADHAFIGPRLPDLDLVGDRLADVLPVEIEQRRFRDAQQQDRLGMLQYPDARVLSPRIHADQRHHRLAGIRRRIGDVGRQHHVPEQLALAVRASAVALDVGRLSLARREAGRAGQHFGAGHQRAQVRRGGQFRRQGGLVCAGVRLHGKAKRQQAHGEARRKPFENCVDHGILGANG
ncbi:hypothetical protein D9M72_311170 [compost metagenome]